MFYIKGQQLNRKSLVGQNENQKRLGGLKLAFLGKLETDSSVKKPQRAILSTCAGQKWPPGPALAAPGVNDFTQKGNL